MRGSTVQTVNAIRDIGAGLKTLVGGELTKYNEMMENARKLATDRMISEAAGSYGYGTNREGSDIGPSSPELQSEYH